MWVKGLPRRDAETVARAVEEFLAAFTDRVAMHKKGKPMGTHHLDRVCQAHRITHRLIRPYHPQTNGMVERFTRRLSEELRRQAPLQAHCRNRFRSRTERNAFIALVVDNYNRTRLKCLNDQAPLKLLQNQTGPYTYKRIPVIAS